MKILAIEKELKAIPEDKAKALLENEARKVWELKEKDILREIYFNENHFAVLVLECANKHSAQTSLQELPLVLEGYIDFEIMELRPYTGFARLF